MKGDLDITKITIKRTLTPDGGDEVWVKHSDGSSLVELLGLLRFAEDSIIREKMEEDHEDS